MGIKAQNSNKDSDERAYSRTVPPKPTILQGEKERNGNISPERSTRCKRRKPNKQVSWYESAESLYKKGRRQTAEHNLVALVAP